MPLISAEAIVLNAYPLAEADLLAVLLTRDLGKVRVVAKSARRLKGRFAGALSVLSHLQVDFYERENRDLSYLRSCDLIESFFDVQSDYSFQVVGAYFAEVLDSILPDRESNPKMFRLLLAMLRARSNGVEPAYVLAYFNVWLLRLSGLLPAFESCFSCGRNLRIEGGRFVSAENRMFCASCPPQGGNRVAGTTIQLASAVGALSVEKIKGEKGFSEKDFVLLNSILEPLVVRAVERPLKTLAGLRELRMRF